MFLFHTNFHVELFFVQPLRLEGLLKDALKGTFYTSSPDPFVV